MCPFLSGEMWGGNETVSVITKNNYLFLMSLPYLHVSFFNTFLQGIRS